MSHIFQGAQKIGDGIRYAWVISRAEKGKVPAPTWLVFDKESAKAFMQYEYIPKSVQPGTWKITREDEDREVIWESNTECITITRVKRLE